ncbi:MAG: sigma factor, partial [bacterium]|nr:sigma factor [bacterium]
MQSANTNEARALEQKVLAAQTGNRLVRDTLILELATQALVSASRICGRHLTTQDDEYSVVLLAIDETISAFRADREASFMTLMAIVIKRRLIDYWRKEAKYKDLPRSSFFDNPDSEQNEMLSAEIKESFNHRAKLELADDYASEITFFVQDLRVFGLSFEDLVASSPKHFDSRQSAVAVARKLVNSDSLWHQCSRTHVLPV